MRAMASQITSSRFFFIQLFIKDQIKETPKLRVTSLCAGNSPVTGEFPAKKASNAENYSIWWRHHANTGTDTNAVCMLKNILVAGNSLLLDGLESFECSIIMY